ncbi:50S ribosomal protein L10 [Alphaproteobacteria bacterium endosymbiont of Tiliacea citrago]|uniref:50S ribosomal protein L10 n=1 Tax=Alphaproteobacteria bacterium endosymbiont of Tiliacea citrago TaxID=3077944 RepID=UPI00313CBC27
MIKLEKQELAQKLKEKFSDKLCGLVLSHKKITYEQIDQARRSSTGKTTVIKIKNKLAQKAFDNTTYNDAVSNLKLENLFIFGDDFFEASKIAATLEKDVKDVKIIKAASSENKNHDLNFVYELASIGSKENLQSKVLSVISEVTKKALRVVNARCEKLREGN